MPRRPPATLTKKLSEAALLEVMQWWRALSPAEQRGLCDTGRPPRGVMARFVEPGDEDATTSLDYYEYLVNHEVSLMDGRTFHICSAHDQARSAFSSGRIPAAFVCPRSDIACPMRRLLDEMPGHDILLSRVGNDVRRSRRER
jgi:hypothetical protein